MKQKPVGMLTLACIFSALFTAQAKATNDNNMAALNEEALNIVKQFGGTLKPRLKEALQSGGLSHAINVCSVQAPEIAKKLSMETGWKVKRVSLKPRNSKNATADEWEHGVLMQFNKRQSKGESPKTIAYSEIVDSQFRYMKAQSVEALCLNCHGETLSPDVERAIKQHYADDKATGYSLGQIRGAFSLTKDL